MNNHRFDVLTIVCRVSAFCTLGVLMVLVGSLVVAAARYFDARVLSQIAFYSALLGSTLIALASVAMALPLGVGAGIYLEEFAKPGPLRTFMRRNVASLLGVPSLVYGIVGFSIFGHYFWSKESSGVVVASLTMAIVIFPWIVWHTQSALRTVPKSVRFESYALGATRWQTVYSRVLPVAGPRILRGTALATAKALGEAAPLLALLLWASNRDPSAGATFSALPIVVFESAKTGSQSALGITCIIVLCTIVSALLFLTRRWSQDDPVDEMEYHHG